MTVSSTVVAAQNGITGRVSDSASRPLADVSVRMMPASGGAVTTTRTGSDGTYRFDNVQDGTYRIDFELARFDVARRNNIRVSDGASVFVDAALQEARTCHCNVVITGMPLFVERSGQVLDTAGRPLPRARLEIVIPTAGALIRPFSGETDWREVAYADADGRFSVVVPVESNAALTASDTGFAPVKQTVSGSGVGSIVLRLPYLENVTPESHERLPRGCRCPSNLFTHRD